jgi:uncharacterized protein YegP (UPF0339 family)
MGKLLRASVLFAAIAGLMVATALNNPAPAQVKDKKDDKAKVTAPEVGTIEVYTDKKGEWRFRVKVDDKSIAIGTVGFDKKEDVLKVVETLKATMAKGKVVEIKADKDKKGDKQ